MSDVRSAARGPTAHFSSGFGGLVAPFVLAANAVTGCFALKGDVRISDDSSGDAGAVEAGAPPVSSFIVDQSGQTEGSFPTITAALAAANASTADAKVIRVLPGAYGSDESFPLVLRDGISIEGAAPDGKSAIVGVGVTSFASPPSSNGTVSAAFVIGDSVKTTRVSNLTFRSPVKGRFGSEAIVCDRGNAGFDPSPNVIIDHVTFQGFEVDVRALALPGEHGCHLRAVTSTFEDSGYGVLAQGQAKADGTPIAVDGTPTSVVTVHLGDGTAAGGNTFQRIAITSGPRNLDGTGLYALDAVVGITADHNLFTSSDEGIVIEQGGGADTTHGARIDSNEFGPLQNVGLGLIGKATVTLLTDNHFHEVALNNEGIVLSGNNPFAGTAILIDPQQYGGIGSILARHNSISGSAIGVHVRGAFGEQSITPEAAAGIDFGTALSMGANDFRCNSAPRQETNGSGSSFGGDVFVNFATQTAPVTMVFVGNYWDHAPPTMRVGMTSNDQGIDVLASDKVTIDTAGATLSTLDCPPSNYHGP